jgi:quercetin dioxygenase-like cupin family protein
LGVQCYRSQHHTSDKQPESEARLVRKAAKEFFYVVVFVVIASALGATQIATGTTTQASSSQAPAKSNTSTTTPAANADASGVIFFPSDQVSQTFAKGATLYNGNPERNYRVHIFHRDTPGEVEIHTKDVDVLYVLEGSATFVTGGTVNGGKETAPGEIRVASMDGGVVRRLNKGDIIIVPANVTHWFKEVQQPITYLGVKVR